MKDLHQLEEIQYRFLNLSFQRVGESNLSHHQISVHPLSEKQFDSLLVVLTQAFIETFLDIKIYTYKINQEKYLVISRAVSFNSQALAKVDQSLEINLDKNAPFSHTSRRKKLVLGYLHISTPYDIPPSWPSQGNLIILRGPNYTPLSFS